MLKYLDSDICLSEIPGEISLGISILGCPVHCPECHSKFTWDANNPEGKILNIESLTKLMNSNKHISCILFFGGEWNYEYLRKILHYIKCSNLHMKTALYTGLTLDEVPTCLLRYLDYIKVGPYDSKYGDLRNPNTNQRLYQIDCNGILNDITYKFHREI